MGIISFFPTHRVSISVRKAPNQWAAKALTLEIKTPIRSVISVFSPSDKDVLCTVTTTGTCLPSFYI